MRYINLSKRESVKISLNCDIIHKTSSWHVYITHINQSTVIHLI